MSKVSVMKLSLVLFVTLFLSTIHAFPNGAASCPPGKAAVDGFHLATVGGRKVFPKTLPSKGVKISIGNATIAAGSTGLASFGKNVAVTISGSKMKGILIRIQPPNGVSASTAFVPGPKLQKCRSCTGTLGSGTQKSAIPVDSYGGTIKFDSSTKGVVFDITVVFSNNAQLSEYAYGRVTVDFTKN